MRTGHGFSRIDRAALVVLVMTSTSMLGQTWESQTMAVSDLIGQGVSQSEAAVVSEQVRSEIIRIGKFRIVERNQMQEILKEQGFQQTGCTDDACAVQIGQLLGVKRMLVGTLGKAGSYTLLTVRVLDVATGEVTATQSVRTKGGVDKMIEGGIQTICEKLSSDLQAKTQDPKLANTQSNDSQAAGKRKARKIWLIGGISVVVAAIAVPVVYILMQPQESTSTTSTFHISGSLEHY